MTATETLLAAARNRLRVAWLLATSEVFVPVIVFAAFVLVVLGWLVPWGWLELAAIVVVIAGIAGVVIRAALLRITPLMSARAVDKELRSDDAFTASLQFSTETTFGGHIATRAEQLAQAHSPADAVPWHPQRRNWAVVALIGIGAIVLAFVANPQDVARAQSDRTAEVIDAEADALEDLAADIEELPSPSDAELALVEELRALAEELRQLDDLELAQQKLELGAETFAPDQASLLASKAAAQGLNRSLQAEPLAGSQGSAAEQLAQLAQNLDDLSPDQAQALAERLDALAATQGAGNTQAQQALSGAAAALRAGDSGGAQAALGEAANAQAGGEAGVRAGQAGQAAAAASTAGAGRLSDAHGDGSGQGDGDGQGDGGGDGSGAGDGSGGGEGSGGEGSGSGSGSGGSGDGSAGNPSGDVTGASGGSDASGRGGVGTPNGNGDSTELGTESDTPTLFNPGGASDELFPSNTPNGDPETVGLAQGPTNTGQTRVPVNDVLPEFEQRAVDAVDDPTIAPSTRALVRRYFDSLAGF